VQKLVEVEKLSKAMTEIHAQVAEKSTRDRKAVIKRHNDKTHVRSPKFQVRYYVLVAEHRKSSTSKLLAQRKNPRSVASVESDFVFVVENLLKKELKAAYATRLRLSGKGTQCHCGAVPGRQEQRPRAVCRVEDIRVLPPGPI
jgi:hypothetical protein